MRVEPFAVKVVVKEKTINNPEPTKLIEIGAVCALIFCPFPFSSGKSENEDCAQPFDALYTL